MKDFLTIIITFLGLITTASAASGSGENYGTLPQDISEKEQFHIYYICDSPDIDTSYLDNRQQIARIRYYLQNSPRIDSITIYSWSSPEGSYRRNSWLARERGKSARKFLLANSPDSSRLSSDKIKISPYAENWP